MGVFGALSGFGMAWGLGIGLWIVSFILDMGILETFFLLPLHGLIQWAYLIPLSRKYKRKHESTKAAGLLIGGGLIFILSSACYGMMFLS